MSSQKQRKSKYLGALELLRAQLNAPQSSNSDHVGEVDELPSGNPSSFFESEDGVDSSVKEPEISSVSLNVVVAAIDLLETPRASNLQPEPALCDLVGGEMVPDVGEVICPSESSSSTDEGDDDDESLKFGDSSCSSDEPFYFAKAPSKSFSKRYGSEVSRHDIAFVRGELRLVCL